ncbi:MAG TPA: hypothetical protein VFP27_18650 [Mycobacterium sp.]|nr:hypothetical protein [Mycobacterium sp.]
MTATASVYQCGRRAKWVDAPGTYNFYFVVYYNGYKKHFGAERQFRLHYR